MLMTWVVEIVLVCVFLIGAYYGYVCGLFKMIVRPLRTLLSLMFAYVLCNPIGNILFAPALSSSITNYVGEYLKNESPNRIPTIIRLAAELVGKYEFSGTEGNAAEIVKELTAPLVVLISSATAFVLLFLFAKMLFSFMVNVVNKLFSAGVIGKVNRFLGLVLACVFSLFVLWALVGVSDLIFHSQALAKSDLIRNYQPGPIYKTMQEISLIELLLSF